METKTYTTIDRAALGWPHGPWDGEPDKAQWPDAATGLPCLAVRNAELGHWCGYVGVPPGHPWHGSDFEADEFNPDVHGGLTFSGPCNPGHNETKGICHTPGPDEPADVWWFGFDCCHSWDTGPAFTNQPWAISRAGVYRTLGYVQQQCTLLASQLDQDMQAAP